MVADEDASAPPGTTSAIELSDQSHLRRRKPTTTDSDSDDDTAEPSIERVFDGKPIPGWREQLTIRAFAVSLLLGVMFSVIVMKLNLTTGIIPSLNVSAGLLGFFFVKSWTKLLEKAGSLRQPFTRQENTVIQTCVVATSGIAFSVLDRGLRGVSSASES